VGTPNKFDSFEGVRYTRKTIDNCYQNYTHNYSKTHRLTETHGTHVEMSFNMQEKISVAEAHLWLANLANEVGAEVPDVEALTSLRPKDFKCPRKLRVSKKSSSGSERETEDYDEVRCDARVWVHGGFGGQCTRKKVDGHGCFCKSHFKENEEKGGSKNGLITGERPTHHYGDEEKPEIPWHDVVIEKKAKKTAKKTSAEDESGKKARKCSYCHCEGHTIRKCKQKVADLEEKDETDEVKISLADEVKKLKALLAQKDKDASDDGTQACDVGGSSIAPTETCDVANLEDFTESSTSVSVEECDAESLKRMAEYVEDDVKEVVVDLVSQVESNGEMEEDDEELTPGSKAAAGTGLEEVKAAQESRVSKLQSKESKEESIMPVEEDVDISDDEDDDDFTNCDLDGVAYSRDEDNIVYDDEMEQVGTWNGEAIKFSKLGLRNHNHIKKTVNECA